MYTAKPVYPISVKLEKAAEVIEKALREKNWRRFEKGEIKLVLTPFYLFYYDAALPGEKKGKTERARLALNGETAELGKELADSIPDDASLVRELPDEYPLVVRSPLFSEPEARKIAVLKTASMLGVSREDLVLTGFKMIYYPMWIAFATVAGQTYQLEISAVSGEVFGEEKVPEREKGFVEITKETLEELKQPGAWVKYSKEIAAIAGEKLYSHKESESRLPEIMRRPGFWISLVLLAVLVALILFF
jgi:hypothetical protein